MNKIFVHDCPKCKKLLAIGDGSVIAESIPAVYPVKCSNRKCDYKGQSMRLDEMNIPRPIKSKSKSQGLDSGKVIGEVEPSKPAKAPKMVIIPPKVPTKAEAAKYPLIDIDPLNKVLYDFIIRLSADEQKRMPIMKQIHLTEVGYVKLVKLDFNWDRETGFMYYIPADDFRPGFHEAEKWSGKVVKKEMMADDLDFFFCQKTRFIKPKRT